MAITTTSLTHPTMIAKTSKALMIGIGVTLLTACQSSGVVTAVYSLVGGLIV